jgi:FAD synthase
MSITEQTQTEVSGDDKTTQISARMPLRMVSKVVRGFGRGSSDLGIPTANLCSKEGLFGENSFDNLPTGIYWGFARIGQSCDESDLFKAAVSIGFNPTYGNEKKTVEPHLIAQPGDSRRHASSCGESVLRDFYNEPIRLSVIGYLRPELPFEGLEKLIVAIKNDIVNAEILCDGVDPLIIKEKEWVKSNAAISGTES